MDSLMRYHTASKEDFQGRVLVLAIAHAQQIMNIVGKENDLAKLKAKAVELLNSPDNFKERLALSVAALLPDEAFQSTKDEVVSNGVTYMDFIEDIDLELAIPDAFDALAGVTPE